MENNSFYLGSYLDYDPARKGWFLGKFMDDKVRKTDKLEIKYFNSQTLKHESHPAKISKTLECTIIFSGYMKGKINDQDMVLEAGNYIVTPPNTPNQLTIEISNDLQGFTIKAPSDPTAKHII